MVIYYEAQISRKFVFFHVCTHYTPKPLGIHSYKKGNALLYKLKREKHRGNNRTQHVQVRVCVWSLIKNHWIV